MEKFATNDDHVAPMPDSSEVFVSYASADRSRVVEIVRVLEAAGISLWQDQREIAGGENYGPRIVQGIRAAKVLLLMCTDASLRSKNVKQEIQLAWKYGRRYLPLLLDTVSFPEQIEYWLEGCQWIEVLDQPQQRWLPALLRSLRNAEVNVPLTPTVAELASATPLVAPPVASLHSSLDDLFALARYTDQLWPAPAARVERGMTRPTLRDLGAPQEAVDHSYRIGGRVCVLLESDRAGHLILLDKGTSGKIYCLCPSHFAPNAQVSPGRNCFPQANTAYQHFEISGRTGREHLLAIITDDSLGLDWMPSSPRIPARELAPGDIELLLLRLRALDADRWTALSTYFDIST